MAGLSIVNHSSSTERGDGALAKTPLESCQVVLTSRVIKTSAQTFFHQFDCSPRPKNNDNIQEVDVAQLVEQKSLIYSSNPNIIKKPFPTTYIVYARKDKKFGIKDQEWPTF